MQRYKKAGLIILGKTNVPEFGLSPVTEPELFGPTYNPLAKQLEDANPWVNKSPLLTCQHAV